MERCRTCGVSLGTFQQSLFGDPPDCIQCQTNKRAAMYIAGLPDPEEWEMQRLSDWEQGFLLSVRVQFKMKGTLTEKQFQALERIWDKMNT